MKHLTKFNISKRPISMALLVETTFLTITSSSGKWKAEEKMKFKDDYINILMVFRGQLGQEYEMTLEINSIKKTIKGKLKSNGISRIYRKYKKSTFKI